MILGALVALRKESVDRNMLCLSFRLGVGWSLSARRAWIEMCDVSLDYKEVLVALRKESVDRNHVRYTASARPSVALRKESVDRNHAMQVVIVVMDTVALRKESVDRNCVILII